MGRIFLPLALAALLSLDTAGAQVVDKALVERHLAEGEIARARGILEGYWSRKDGISRADSLFVLKHLGVLYTSSPRTAAKGERLFEQLLLADPFASLHDSPASHSIILRFKRIKKRIQEEKGGRALAPIVAVFDMQGPQDEADRRALTGQFVAELRALDFFHVLDPGQVRETVRRLGRDTGGCATHDCMLDIAARLAADKAARIDAQSVDTVMVCNLLYLDVEGRASEARFKKVYHRSLERFIAEGLRELAMELRAREAAWLNLAVEPKSAVLEIDGRPSPGAGPRLPLPPGKHRICARSPGYEPRCKDFMARKDDPVTYSLTLKLKGDALPNAPEPAGAEAAPDEADAGAGPPEDQSGLVWTIIGSMALLAVVLALMWNSRD